MGRLSIALENDKTNAKLQVMNGNADVADVDVVGLMLPLSPSLFQIKGKHLH